MRRELATCDLRPHAHLRATLFTRSHRDSIGRICRQSPVALRCAALALARHVIGATRRCKGLTLRGVQAYHTTSSDLLRTSRLTRLNESPAWPRVLPGLGGCHLVLAGGRALLRASVPSLGPKRDVLGCVVLRYGWRIN